MTVSELVKLFLDATVAAGSDKPVLSPEARKEADSTLTRMMVNRPLLRQYLATLRIERRQRKLDKLLDARQFQEVPIDDIIQNAFVNLRDDQLVELATRPIFFSGLYELIEELLNTDAVGGIWRKVVEDEETRARASLNILDWFLL